MGSTLLQLDRRCSALVRISLRRLRPPALGDVTPAYAAEDWWRPNVASHGDLIEDNLMESLRLITARPHGQCGMQVCLAVAFRIATVRHCPGWMLPFHLRHRLGVVRPGPRIRPACNRVSPKADWAVACGHVGVVPDTAVVCSSRTLSLVVRSRFSRRHPIVTILVSSAKLVPQRASTGHLIRDWKRARWSSCFLPCVAGLS